MKLKFLLFIMSIFLTTNILQAQEKTATDILNEAFAQAKEENKNVMVIFSASWCGWCKRLIANINDDSCFELFDKNYVITKMIVKESKNNKNLETPGGLQLLIDNKADKVGIPFFLIYDADGNLLTDAFDDNGQNLGCPASKEEVAVFKNKLKATSTLTDEELAIIEEKFILKK
ncbi:MAG: thioredoxin family protein [Flavobacteriaceae bacterium]|nr:thioredoxin family protein [Flavobacteriaceae bacterium]